MIDQQQKPEPDLTGYKFSELREMAFRQAWERHNGVKFRIALDLGISRPTVTAWSREFAVQSFYSRDNRD